MLLHFLQINAEFACQALGHGGRNHCLRISRGDSNVLGRADCFLLLGWVQRLGLGDGVAGGADPRDSGANRDSRVGRYQHSQEYPGLLCLHLDGGLVGFHNEERLTGGNRIPFFAKPLYDAALLHFVCKLG